MALPIGGPTSHGFYHLRGGFHFRRNADGTIMLWHRHDPFADEGDSVMVDADQFASVMAFLSLRGENGETWQEARRYLARLAASEEERKP